MEAFLRDLSDIFHNPYVALIFATALAFDFINGFHDAANSIATIVGTGVLRPFQAVCWAAWWNFAAAWFFGVHVANAVAKWVHAEYVTPEVIFAGLLGAIVWNLITWHGGLPSSSSHALLGGFGGAAVVHAGKFTDVLYTAKVVATVEFIVIAPMLGLALGLIFTFLLLWALRKVSAIKVDRHFRHGQLASAAAYSLGHGTNDAQKTMGIIAGLLFANHLIPKFEIPTWVIFSAYISMALGTLSGGWRIVRTMGMRITALKPIGGFAAEVAAAASLFSASALGIPVSTTHTITGAIVGVGSLRRLSAVRWGVATRIIWAWLLTIPLSAGIAALSQF